MRNPSGGSVDRESVVQMLIADQLEKVQSGKSPHWLLRVLENGFTGFANMPELELCAELKRRGLAAEFQEPQEPVDEPEDADAEEDEDDEIRMCLQSVPGAGGAPASEMD